MGEVPVDEAVERHTRRLRLICGASVAALAAYVGVVAYLPAVAAPALPQAAPLLWGFAFAAAANLVTIMPVYRGMMAGPRRVYLVGRQPEKLLAAHLTAHLVAFARLEAVGVLGLVLYFLAARRDWFYAFTAVAALGMLALWPIRSKVAALLAVPDQAPSAPA